MHIPIKDEVLILNNPIYDIESTWSENIQKGPTFQDTFIPRTFPDKKEWKEFLGYPIASPLGIPAGPLLSSAWIDIASRLGFDILTYKTIRSRAHESHPLPNVLFVDAHASKDILIAKNTPPHCIEEISITNSFGMPSMPPDYLQSDIQKARSFIKEGQILIVSIVGTPEFSSDLLQDFVTVALIAKEAGAHAIEANFSCPNVSLKEGSLYTDIQYAPSIAKAIVDAISPLPLIIKVGKFPHFQHLKDILIAFAKAGVRAIAGLNSISKKVLNEQGQSALGAHRQTSGICGALIRPDALLFIQQTKHIIETEKISLEIVGCGGILLPHHFNEFFDAGAHIATTATGFMWDPNLANKWHTQYRK
jgi:dihydroorotate dehydrogenase (NAD+) catalytic subunit